MSTPTAAVFGHPSYAQMDELIDAIEALTSIDNAMSSTSEHPVQNKAIKAYVDSNVDEMNTAISELEDAVSDILGNFASGVEVTTTASKSYKVGELLIMNRLLYRVTTAIASGGTITPNTNCVQTTVGDEVANNCLVFENVTVSATTGDIATITDARITADHVVVECGWGNASAITTDVTCTTSAGSAVINGTCTTATTATVTLVKKCN